MTTLESSLFPAPIAPPEPPRHQYRNNLRISRSLGLNQDILPTLHSYPDRTIDNLIFFGVVFLHRIFSDLLQTSSGNESR